MCLAPTKVIEASRVTIPVDVREKLGIEEGDYVIIDVEPFEGGQR